MGFIDKISDAISGSDGTSGGSDEIAESLEMEEEPILEGSDELIGDDDEDEEQVWDTAYRFFEDFVEEDGHIDGMDFAKSAAFYEVSNSNMYRDRIQSGKDTIETVAAAKETIESVKRSGDTESYGEKAEKLKQANELINQVDKVSGKEDEIISEALDIGRKFAGNLTDNIQSKNRDIQTNVSAHDDEL